MNKTSAPVTGDEMALAGLAKTPARLVRPPLVAASPVHFECKVLKFVELPDVANPQHVTVTFGQVVGVHINESVLIDDTVDYAKLDAIARLGGADYARMLPEGVFQMQRPDG